MRVKVIGYIGEMLSLPSEGQEVLLDEPLSLGELTIRLWNVPFSMFTGAKVGDMTVSEEYELSGDEEEVILISPVHGGGTST